MGFFFFSGEEGESCSVVVTHQYVLKGWVITGKNSLAYCFSFVFTCGTTVNKLSVPTGNP